jgi:hypothetical protein
MSVIILSDFDRAAELDRLVLSVLIVRAVQASANCPQVSLPIPDNDF